MVSSLVMAGHSPMKTGVNALVPGHPEKCGTTGATLSEVTGTSPVTTKT